MAKRPKRNEGHGDNLPDHAAIRLALAIEVLDQEKAAELREARKRHRKHAQGNNIDLKDLDRLYALRDSSASDVERFFRRTWNMVGAVFTDLGEQFDLFAPRAAAPARKAAHRHLGLMAGLIGKPADAPPGLTASDLNEWLEGHHEGADTRARATTEILNSALSAENGEAIDATPSAVTAKAHEIHEQAAADFAEDNPDALPGETIYAEPDIEADEPDLAEVEDEFDPDAEARRLKDSGFVPHKAPSRLKNTVHVR